MQTGGSEFYAERGADDEQEVGRWSGVPAISQRAARVDPKSINVKTLSRHTTAHVRQNVYLAFRCMLLYQTCSSRKAWQGTHCSW